MKFVLLGIVLLAAGTLAAAQSVSPAPSARGLFGENPSPGFSGKDLLKMPPLAPDRQFGILASQPAPLRANRLGDLSIDPGIRLRPTPKSLGTETPGILIAQNKFPGLTLLPVDARIEPIPTTFPLLKFGPIPIDASKWQSLMVGSDATALLGSSQK
jgi:hypothetical protein